MISQNVIMLHEWSYLHISFIYSLIWEKKSNFVKNCWWQVKHAQKIIAN